MGKRKDDDGELEIDVGSISSSHKKKHKKHKHKKHKKNKADTEKPAPLLVVVPQPMIKVEKPSVPSKKSKKGRRDSGTSSDEERWLDAIESGKLEEVDDELMKMKPKDPKLMTARQRAMLRTDAGAGAYGEETLVALPSGYKEKVMTAEMVQKAALKSQRRKQQADEKKEKDKKKTMDRILKKQESKSGKGNNQKGRYSKKLIPRITYHISAQMSSISIPPDIPFPLQAVVKQEYPEVILCGVNGCLNPKRYSCSQTGVPLCSMSCYKRNLAGTEFAINAL